MKSYLTEYSRYIFAATVSPLLAFFSPTKGFILALVIMFAFNIWAGMRADGVSIIRCTNFSFPKFKDSLKILALYLAISLLIFTVMVECGDKGAALLTIKTLTYIFMYVYLQNAFKNLMVAYPKNKALWIIYHLIRLEFKKMMPSYIQPILDKFEAREKAEKERKEKENEQNKKVL